MHTSIKFYLWLCPDADYNILELLRKNITKINPYYKNYQTACYEYLKELTQLKEADPNNLGQLSLNIIMAIQNIKILILILIEHM